jgi:hypothetical protein
MYKILVSCTLLFALIGCQAPPPKSTPAPVETVVTPTIEPTTPSAAPTFTETVPQWQRTNTAAAATFAAAPSPTPKPHETFITFCDDVPGPQRVYVQDFFASARREMPDPGDAYARVCYDASKLRQLSNFNWETTLGVAYRNSNTLYMDVSARNFERSLSDPWTFSVMPHEYYHLVQMYLSSRNFGYSPTWLVEGSADYEAFRFMDKLGKYSYADPRRRKEGPAVRAFKSGSNLDALENPGARYGDTYSVGFFASEWLATMYGEDSVTKFWENLGKNGYWPSAFKTTFGLPVEEFYDKFNTWAGKDFAPIKK